MKWYNPWSWVPFTLAGRQTLIYVCIALCAPILTGCIMWTLWIVKSFPDATAEQRLDKFAALAEPLTWSLMIIVVAFACFVSIRAVKLGPLEATSHDDPQTPSDAANRVADAAIDEAAKIAEKAP